MNAMTNTKRKRFTNLLIATAALLFIGPSSAAAEEIDLVTALEEALAGNPSLAAAGARGREAQAGVAAERSKLLPSVVLQGEYARYEEPALVYPMHTPPTPSSPLSFDDQVYTGAIRLEVPVLELPALASLGARTHLAAAGRGETEATRQSILQRVTELFVRSEQLRDARGLLDGNLEALRRRREELQLLRDAGRASPADLAVLSATISARLAEVLSLKEAETEVALGLGELLGRAEAVYPQAVTFRDQVRFPAEPESGGPAVQVAEARRSAAESRRQATFYSFAPSVSLFAVESARSGAAWEFESEWSAGVTVTVPLITGGARLAAVREANAALDAADEGYGAARLRETAGIAAARRKLEIAIERGELLQEAVAAQEVSVAATESRYEEGRASLSDLLTEEATFLNYRVQERSAHYEGLLALLGYYQLTGTLSPETIEGLIEE